MKKGDGMAGMVGIIFSALILLLFDKLKAFLNRKEEYKKLISRYRYLKSKYNDKEIVRDIFRGTIKIGYTVDMLIDAWGEPCKKQEDVKKTKVKNRIFKYNNCGKNRYKDWIYIENEKIIGWKEN